MYSFIFSESFIFKSLIHFQLILCMMPNSNLTFNYYFIIIIYPFIIIIIIIQFSQYYLWKCSFLHCKILDDLSQIKCPYIFGVYFCIFFYSTDNVTVFVKSYTFLPLLLYIESRKHVISIFFLL